MNIPIAYKWAANITKANIQMTRKIIQYIECRRRDRICSEDLQEQVQRSVTMPNIGDKFIL